ncbi:MAG: rRNA methyltransferase [Armatimonadetes bacterium]|nr:rRNA methyltransferase [Armatimonadota bacterium]
MTDDRNVVDYYKYWTTEAIVADLDTKRHNFSVLCANVQGDFNVGTVIRNANAFLASMVYLYGRRKYNRNGAVGTQHYTHFKHVQTIEDVTALTESAMLVAVDNVPGAEDVATADLPLDRHVIFVFGEEGTGVSPELLALCEKTVYIKQFGSVRSLNVGTASGIVMYEYCRRLTQS